MELSEAQIDALLDDDGDLTRDIEAAAEAAVGVRLRRKEQQLQAAITTTRRRMRQFKELIHRCIQVAIEAKTNGRADLVAAAREREGEYLARRRKTQQQLPRLEKALADLQARIRRLP